jgi:hypothetical protein
MSERPNIGMICSMKISNGIDGKGFDMPLLGLCSDNAVRMQLLGGRE